MKIQSVSAFVPKKLPKTDLWSDGKPWDPRNQPAELLDRGPDGETTVSGFRWGWTEATEKADWQPHFQNTTIDPKALKDVHFYIEHFFPAGHAALVFEFEEGGVKGADGQVSDRMVYSIEARKKEGMEWSAKAGLGKTMGMVHQLMTFKDAQQWVTRYQGATLETRRLNLDAEQKQRLLQQVMEETLADRTGEYYHTTRNSCYSGLQKVLNSALPESASGLTSPLSAGLLMKPEAFMTSAYNTVLKDKGLFTRENSAYYLPDAELHGAERAELAAAVENPGWLTRLASHAAFPVATRIAGAALGAGLGLAVTDSVLASAVVGYAGYKVGAVGGDMLEGKALRSVAN